MIASGDLASDVFAVRVRATRAPDRATYGDMIGLSASALAVADRVCFEMTVAGAEHAGTCGLRLSRLSLTERARANVEIAHPDDRADFAN